VNNRKAIKEELRHLEAIVRICKQNAPDMLHEQNSRIANEIKSLKRALTKKVKKKK
jgi:hypothetical protein